MKLNEIIAITLLVTIGVWIALVANAPTVSASTNDVFDCGDTSCAVALTNGNNVDKKSISNNIDSTSSDDEVQIINLSYSRGYYVPREFSITAGKKVRINFDQSKFTGCMTTFNIYQLGIKAYVPTTPYIEFSIDKPGVYRTGCNMGMGDGRITVISADGSSQKETNIAEPAPLPKGLGCDGSCGGGCNGGCGECGG